MFADRSDVQRNIPQATERETALEGFREQPGQRSGF